MLDKSKNNMPCSFSKQVISYFYNETEASELKDFEAHLETCETCLDELSGFNAVRSSISEWRKIEFSGLETPIFNFLPVPTEKTTDYPVSSGQNWWMDFKERFFPASSIWAASVFAALILCVGLSFIIFNHSNKPEVAGLNKMENSIAVSNAAEIKRESNDNFPGSNSLEQSSNEFVQEPVLNNKGAAAVNDSAPETFVTKVANELNANKKRNSPRETKKTTSTGRKSNSTINTGKPPLSKTGKMPFLTDIEEVEDESLRLADLFDEVDAK
jgi:hypothetical protein